MRNLLPPGWNFTTIDAIATTLTDYVANGSFATLREFVTYKDIDDFALLLRTTDYTKEFKGPFVFVDESSYNFLAKSKVFPGDIVVSNVGAVGIVFLAPDIGKPMTLGPNAILLRTNQNNKYIYYYLSSHFGQAAIANIVSGNAQLKFNKTEFRTIPIPLPSLSEQHYIAEILDTVDVTIAQTEALIAKLKQAKAGLLNDLLTCGLDERGQLRDPTAHPEQFKATKIGRIPKEWNCINLGAVAEISSGVTLGRDLQEGLTTIELPYLRVANVQDGYLDLTEVKKIRVYKSELPRYLLRPGDVLMNEGGDYDKLGRGTVWSGVIEPCLHQNHVFKVRTDRNNITTRSRRNAAVSCP